MKRKALLGLLLITALFTRCEVPDEAPEWSPDYYGPIAKSKLDIEDISKLEDLIFEQEVEATDIDTDFEGEVEVPPFELNRRVGPYEFEITDIFEKINADSFVFKISFTNAFPINIKEGTILTFENKEDGNQVYRHRIRRDIAPSEEYTFGDTLGDKIIESNVNFYLDEFASDGSNGEKVKFDQGLETTFRFELIFLEIKELIIETRKAYRIKDTTEFDFGGGIDTTTSARGQLFIYFQNRFPLAFDVQLNLLDENKNLIDSVFGSAINLGGSPVNQQGYVIGQEVESVDTVELNTSNINDYQNAAYLSGVLKARTLNRSVGGNPIEDLTLQVEEKSFLKIQIAGDIKGAIN